MKPKIIISLLIFLLTGAMPSFSQTADEASEAYKNGDYKKSVEIYEQIIKEHKENNEESEILYYNLANAYFRQEAYSKAILNYERALLLSPGDKDIRHNLAFAKQYTEDKIDISNSFFLKVVYNKLLNLLGADSWGALSIALFVIVLCCATVFLLTKSILIKKVSFYSSISLLFIALTTNGFAMTQKKKLSNRNKAIITAPVVTINASPDRNSKELFILHSGTKVKINKTESNWYEIEISNGSVGWLTKDKIEII